MFPAGVFSFEKLPTATKAELKSAIESCGGTTSYLVSDKVTHLISTERELKNQSNYAIKNARKKGIVLTTPTAVLKEAKAYLDAHGPTTSGSETSGLKDFDDNLSLLATSSNSLTSSSGTTHLVVGGFANVDYQEAPTLTLLLPSHGSSAGGYKVALFGLNMAPGPSFRVKFGDTECIDYEFHASTSVIATVPSLPRAVTRSCIVAASNNGGRSYGYPQQFQFTDVMEDQRASSDAAKIMILTSQLKNMHRAIASLQQMEHDLQTRMHSLSNYSAPGSVADNGVAASTASARAKHVDRFERELKLFISSPFRDMRQERDVVVKLVIPKFRRLCMERGVIFSFVDLRWGVTKAQTESAATLKMILGEIENSDMLLGFYGERYGWSVSEEHDSGDNELLRRSFEMAKKSFPWIEELQNRSVTEIEMRCILDHHYDGPSKRAAFYLRDEYYVEEVDPKEKVFFQSEGPISKLKLEQLKLEILQSDFDVRNYNRPDQVANTVLDDLVDLLNHRFPEDEPLSADKREDFLHMVFQRSVTQVYLPFENLYMQIDKYISSEVTKPMVITGDRGVGKSALLANWIKLHQEHNPADVVFSHYLGASPTSASYSHMLHRFMSTIQREVNTALVLPRADDFQGIARFFPKWVDSVWEETKKRKLRVVIVLDGFDRLDPRNNAADLVWFPTTLPPQFRVVLSCGAGLSFDILAKRGCSQLRVPPLPEAERKSLLRLYLKKLSKKLEDKQEFTIAGATQTENPRFLLTLLDDVAVDVEFEGLDKKINTDLHAQTTAELYEIVFERLEKDFDPNNEGIVLTFFTTVWAARRGLYLTTELRPILESLGYPPHKWNDFFVVAQEFMFNDMGGMVTFSNSDVRAAVESRYLKAEAKRVEAHLNVSKHFWDMEDVTAERRVEELPFQLERSKQYDKLEKILVDLMFFSKLYTASHKFDLGRYWRTVEKNTKSSADKAYAGVVNRGRFPAGIIVSDLLFDVAKFLQSVNKYDACEDMYHKSIRYYEKASQRLEVAKVYTEIATLYNLQRRFSECERMLEQAKEIYVEEKGDSAPEIAEVMCLMGQVYLGEGKGAEALKVLQDAVVLAEHKLGSSHMSTSSVYYQLGCAFLVNTGELNYLQHAETNFLRALRLKEAMLGDWDPEVSHILNRLGSLYIEQDQYNDAEDCFNRALLIRETKLGPEHSRVAQTLRHMITLYELQEEWDSALKAIHRASRITERIFGVNSWETSGIELRWGSLCFAKSEAESNRTIKAEALEHITKARGIRIDLFGRTSEHVKECDELLAEINNAHSPPPPPPAPPVITPVVVAKKPVNEAVSRWVASGRSAAPPPPPPPSMKAPPKPLAALSSAAPAPQVQYTAMLQGYDQNVMRHAQVETSVTRDYGDAGKAAARMMAKRTKRVQLNTLW